MNETMDNAGWVKRAPPVWVFKQDRRSRVWQIESPDGPRVVKRFEYAPPRQAMAALLGIHPGQRELKVSAELKDKGVAVAPILASGKQWGPLGCRLWLMTPLLGNCIHRMEQQGDLEDPTRRRAVIDAVADLTASLIERGYANRDHKTSNLVYGEDGKLWLIDVGAVRPARGRADTLRMLAMLLKTLAIDEIPKAERQYCLEAIRKRCEFLGPLRQLAKDVDAVRLPGRRG